jgi:hypothetical protein
LMDAGQGSSFRSTCLLTRRGLGAALFPHPPVNLADMLS